MSLTVLGCSESVYSWSVPSLDSTHNLPSLAPNWVAKTPNTPVRQFEVAWAPQLVTFASAGEDGRIIFNRPNGDYLGSLSSVSTATFSLDFHPKSRIMVSGGEDSVVRVWDLKEKRVAMTWKAHAAPVMSVRCSPDEDHVATASIDGILYVHNLRNGKTVTKLQARGEDANDALKMIQYSPFERNRIASCTDKGKVYVWDASRAKIMASITAHIAPTTAISYSRVNAALLISSSLDKTVKLHDIRARKTVTSLSLDHPATSLDLASDGTTLAVGTINGQILIYDLQKDANPMCKLNIPNSSSDVESITFQHPSEHISGSSILKTPRGPSSTNSNEFFAPSPNLPTSYASTTPQSPTSTSNSALTASQPPVELFSPLKSFDAVGLSNSLQMISTQKSSASVDAPQLLSAASVPQLGLSLMSPLHLPSSQSSFSSEMLGSEDSAAINSSNSNMGVTPSGIPFALLSPAPPTPSSYKKYSTRLQSTLFSPLASDLTLLNQPTDSTPIKSTLITHSDIAGGPLSPLVGLSSAASTSIYTANSDSHGQTTESPMRISGFGEQYSLGFSPSISLNSSTPRLGTPYKDASSSTASHGFSDASQKLPPESPTAPKSNSCAPATSHLDSSHEGIQWKLVQSVLGDMMEGFREEVNVKLQTMHLEMIRQFHIQQTEIASMLQQYDTNKQLLEIIKELKEENERLRKLY